MRRNAFAVILALAGVEALSVSAPGVPTHRSPGLPASSRPAIAPTTSWRRTSTATAPSTSATTNSYVAGPVLVSLGDGHGAFGIPAPYPTAQYPQALETADFNRDGFPDLAFTFENSPTVGVLIGGAAGGFDPVVEYSTGAGTHPRDLVAADFNGDGASDLAVMNDNAEGVAILLGTGTGAFQAPTSFPVGNYLRAIDAADLDANGKIDLAVTNVGEQVVSILLGIGNGTFAPRQTFALPPTMFSVAVGHFNNDPHADLAVSGGGFLEPAVVAILAGDGAGGFGARPSSPRSRRITSTSSTTTTTARTILPLSGRV